MLTRVHHSGEYRAMQLRQYLDANKITIPDFAERIGVSVQSVHRYVGNERKPRPEIMEKIRSVTEGHVQPNDFYAEAA